MWLFNGNNHQKVADPRNVVAQFIGHSGPDKSGNYGFDKAL